MKRLFLFLLILFAAYSAKPYWEESISKYIDLSFLEPVDETIENVTTSAPFKIVVDSVSKTVKRAVDYFISNDNADNKQEQQPTEKITKPELTTPENSQISIHNIEIGTSEETVIAMLGQPNDTSSNEYNTQWSTYHQDYHNFLMVSYDDHLNVNAIYTNDDLISSASGMQYNSDKAFVRQQYGTPLTEIKKGRTIYIQDETEEYDIFEVGNLYAYVFYDLHEGDTVTAIQLVAKSLELENDRMYATGNEDLRAGFERQLFDLTNAARVRHGVPFLEWDERASYTAWKHSVDMAVYNYFSHDNLQGLSPFERMQADQIDFRSAGENLAYGQMSSIFAHEGLMNSEGHRKNILLDTYSHLGVGVSFNEESQPYYTENFLLK